MYTRHPPVTTHHAKLLETLKKLEIDGKDLNLIMNLYCQQTASIKTYEVPGCLPISEIDFRWHFADF